MAALCPTSYPNNVPVVKVVGERNGRMACSNAGVTEKFDRVEKICSTSNSFILWGLASAGAGCSTFTISRNSVCDALRMLTVNAYTYKKSLCRVKLYILWVRESFYNLLFKIIC